MRLQLEVGQARERRQDKIAQIYEDYNNDPYFHEWGIKETIVPGEGDVFPKAVIIGEAPGATEQKELRPFVGAAGQVLNQLIESVGCTRDQVFITNVLKYRPKNNRKPTQEEVNHSRPYVWREIKLLRCRRILLMGATATEVIFPYINFKTARTSRLQSDGYVFYPLYHPAFGVYNPANIPIMLEDFRRVWNHGCR